MNNNTCLNINVIYDKKAEESSLPIRKAAAIVVRNNQNKVLIVRRSNVVEEFKGVWSFPSVFIADNDDNIPKTLTERLENWLVLKVGHTKMIGKRMGIRPDWHLLMHLFLAEKFNDPVIHTDKYNAIKWVDGQEYFSRFRYDKLGECTKAYLDYAQRNQGDMNSIGVN